MPRSGFSSARRHRRESGLTASRSSGLPLAGLQPQGRAAKASRMIFQSPRQRERQPATARRTGDEHPAHFSGPRAERAQRSPCRRQAGPRRQQNDTARRGRRVGRPGGVGVDACGHGARASIAALRSKARATAPWRSASAICTGRRWIDSRRMQAIVPAAPLLPATGVGVRAATITDPTAIDSLPPNAGDHERAERGRPGADGGE